MSWSRARIGSKEKSTLLSSVGGTSPSWVVVFFWGGGINQAGMSHWVVWMNQWNCSGSNKSDSPLFGGSTVFGKDNYRPRELTGEPPSCPPWGSCTACPASGDTPPSPAPVRRPEGGGEPWTPACHTLQGGWSLWPCNREGNISLSSYRSSTLSDTQCRWIVYPYFK